MRRPEQDTTVTILLAINLVEVLPTLSIYSERVLSKGDARVKMPIKIRVDFTTCLSSASDLDMVSLLLVFQNLLRRNKSDIGLLAIEQPRDILQSQTASLGVLEPDAEDHRDQDSEEHEVVFPLNRIERDRVDEGVEEGEGERCHLDEGEALGTQLVGPDLDRVGDDERGQGDVVAEEVAVRWSW